MLSFAAAVFLLIITPGPGVLSLAGVGAAYGMRAGWRYFIGLFIGTNLVALAVITGLAALVVASPAAGSRVGFIDAARQPGVRDGIILQAINPKAYVVNTTLFSNFAFFPQSYVAEVALKLLIANIIWCALHVLWLWVGAQIKAMNLAPQTQKRINYGMAAALVGVVVLAILNLR